MRAGKRKKFLNRRMKKWLRLLFYVFSILLAFLIQTSVFPLIPFLSASPNLLLILTFSFGFLHGSLPGMLYGLGAGLLMDMFYSGPFGFYSLIFIFIGYVNGFFSRRFSARSRYSSWVSFTRYCRQQPPLPFGAVICFGKRALLWLMMREAISTTSLWER